VCTTCLSLMSGAFEFAATELSPYPLASAVAWRAYANRSGMHSQE
jgi:hypothetical protein